MLDVTRFLPANGLLDDHEALQAQYARDGYLFFSGVLDVDVVETARADLARALAARGVVDPDAPGATATGVGIEAVDQAELYGLSSYDLVTTSTELQALLDRVFDEPVAVYRSTNIRYALPHDSRHATPPHQDGFFVGPNDDFRTVWIPLMDVPEAVGGLAVARGSHVRGLRAHVEDEEAYSYVLAGRKQKGVPLAAVEEEWVTADYRQGDMLVFHCHTVHRGLPNNSDQVRLSLDVRCQPARRPLNFQARTTTLEQVAYRRSVKEVAVDLGIDEPTFERVVIEMQKTGAPADAATVTRIAADLPPAAGPTGS
jgi:1-deoxypentalenic acid 11beta-hydroxylase